MKDHTILKACPLCGGEDQDLWCRSHSYRIVKCSSCGFVFTKEVPSVDFLRRIYEPGYTNAKDDFKPRGGIGRKLKYLIFSRWIQRFFSPRQTIHALEVGCGQGDFLRSVHRIPRFEAQGVDFAEAPLSYAKSLGLKVSQGDFDSQKFDSETFDLIVALHVLEHVQDVNETLKKMYRLLKPKGMIFLVCPCVSHIKAKLAGESWKYIGPPGHLWYFSPGTLRSFLEKAGFEVVSASCLYHRAHVRILGRKKR